MFEEKIKKFLRTSENILLTQFYYLKEVIVERFINAFCLLIQLGNLRC